ncbi:hypothetical protein DYH09_10830 [bacterium CPR1]|nr:hypothetical protein [bacterium CPR1]
MSLERILADLDDVMPSNLPGVVAYLDFLGFALLVFGRQPGQRGRHFSRLRQGLGGLARAPAACQDERQEKEACSDSASPSELDPAILHPECPLDASCERLRWGGGVRKRSRGASEEAENASRPRHQAPPSPGRPHF